MYENSATVESLKVMANYKVAEGDILPMIVKHIEEDGETFWALKKDSLEHEIPEMREIIQKMSRKEMESLPRMNESFLIYIDQMLLRARRVEPQNGDETGMRIFLCDTGEELNVNGDYRCYEMPAKLQAIPPLALKCKWSGNENEWIDDKPAFLQSKIDETLTLEFLQVHPDALVDIWGAYGNEEQRSESNYDEEKQQVEEARYRVTCDLEMVQSSSSDGESDGIPVCDGFLSLNTREEPEEPDFSTSNAAVAIHGYETRDDERYCKFYNAITGACFKGVNCNKIHLPPLQDGYETRDKAPMNYYGPPERDLPELFKAYEIRITAFHAIPTKFSCLFQENAMDAKKLDKLMNSKEEVEHYVRLGRAPYLLELVILESNGKYMRGRAFDFNEYKRECSVKLLDVGRTETVAFSKLYEWRDRFHFIPFLAMELSIVNLSPKEECREKIIAEILAQSRKAFITGYSDLIECMLLDANDHDIAVRLATLGLATKKNLVFGPTVPHIILG